MWCHSWVLMSLRFDATHFSGASTHLLLLTVIRNVDKKVGVKERCKITVRSAEEDVFLLHSQYFLGIRDASWRRNSWVFRSRQTIAQSIEVAPVSELILTVDCPYGCGCFVRGEPGSADSWLAWHPVSPNATVSREPLCAAFESWSGSFGLNW